MDNARLAMTAEASEASEASEALEKIELWNRMKALGIPSDDARVIWRHFEQSVKRLLLRICPLSRED
jgi:hypothetical protein